MSNWFSKLFDNKPEILSREYIIQRLESARGFLIMDNCQYRILFLSVINEAITYLEGLQDEK